MSSSSPALAHLPRRTLCLGALSVAAGAAWGQSSAPAQAPVVMFNTLPIKPAAMAGFLPVMQANARASREEKGNGSFDVFQSEDGAPTLYLFERWDSQAALEQHMTAPNLKAVAARVPTDLSAKETSLRLTEIAPLGGHARKPFSHAAGSRNVVVRLIVKPGQEQAFLQALVAVIPQARNAPGNHAFELYSIQGQPQEYLVFERWESVAAHEAHLVQDYSRKLDAVLPATLARPVSPATRLLVRDMAG